MRKIFTFMVIALFCASGALAQGALQQVWSVNNYSWNTGISARQAAISGDRMFVQDRLATTVRVIDLATGADIPGAAITNTSFNGAGIAADDAGNLLITQGWAGSNWSLWKIDIATSAVAQVGAGFFNDFGGRTDFISARGDINDNGYVIGVNNATSGAGAPLGQLLGWDVVGGVRNTQLSAAHGLMAGANQLTAGGSATFIDDNRVLITGQNVVAAIATIDFSDPAFITNIQSLETPTASHGGGVVFELGGFTYVALPVLAGVNAGTGAIRVFDITGSTPVQVGDATAAIANVNNQSAYVFIDAAETNINEVTIYVWATDNGAAAHRAVAANAVITPNSGTFVSPQSVTLSSSTTGAVIRYTTDGTTPDASSPLFTSNIDLPIGTTTVRMLVTAPGYFPNLVSATFEVTDGTTGIDEVTNSLHVFGSNGQISVTADNRIESVRVFDLQGRTIHTRTGISLNEYSVAASQGVYIVEVTTTAGRVVKRVIVK